MRRILLVVTCALSLSGCAQGYGYCYDPYQGPRGYYRGPFAPEPHCADPNQGSPQFRGPYYGGYRGPYFSGPHYDAVPSHSPG